MKRFSILVPLLLLTSCDATSLTAKETQPHYDRVLRVKDGDTFVIEADWSPYPNLEWSVRVLGIDAPEKGQRAKCQREKDLSAKARAMSIALIKQSHNRVILRDVKHDKYGGRFDANVFLEDGQSLGKLLHEAKLAKLYNGGGPKPKLVLLNENDPGLLRGHFRLASLMDHLEGVATVVRPNSLKVGVTVPS